MKLRLFCFVGCASLAAACGLSAIGSGGSGLDVEPTDAAATDAVTDATTKLDGATSFDASKKDAARADDAPSDAPPVDAGQDAAVTFVTVISPYDPSGSLTYPIPIDWTLASEPPLPIHYTTDGTDPVATSPGGMSPVVVHAVPGGTTIRWSVADDSAVHMFNVGADAGLESDTVAFQDGFSFGDSGSPIIVAQPGETLQLHVENAWEWNSTTYCPDCIDQLKYGIDGAVGCMLDGNPQVYPGVHQDRQTLVSIDAPNAKGVSYIRVGLEQNFNCDDVIGHTLGKTIVGTVIVK